MMNCNKQYTIKVTEGNAFGLLLQLKSRTFQSSVPIDEDIDATHLEDIVIKVNNEAFTDFTADESGVLMNIPADMAVGTYNVELTGSYYDVEIRAGYFQCFSIVPWSYQSDAVNYIPGSPIATEAAYVVVGIIDDQELEDLKAELRLKIAAAEAAKEAADQAKEDFDEKAEALDNLDNVAQQGTNPDANLSSTQTAAQGAALNSQIARGYIGTPQSGQADTLFGAIANINIDTSTIAQRTDVKDGNDTAISVAKEIRSEVGTGSDTAAESGTLFAVLKWVKDKVKSIFNLIGSPASGQPSTLFAAIAAGGGGGGGGDAQESTSQEILEKVNDILPSQQAVLQSYATLDEKGVAIPSAQEQTIENLPATIGQINKEFVGYAYVSAMTARNSPDNPKLNFSGVVFTGATLNLANMIYIEEIIAPRTTPALTSFTFNPNNTYNYVDVRLMDTRNCTSLNSWGNLKKVNASGLDFRGLTNVNSMFQNQTRVEWIDFSGIKVSSSLTSATNCFASGCAYCTTLVGDHTLQDVIDNNICFFEGLCINLPYFYGMTLLGRNSLRAVINGLADLSGQTTQTFQFGATLLAKLTAEDIAIATAKNWSLT